MPRKPIKISLEPVKARQGVPPHLALRYMEKNLKPKKGAGSYDRKKDHP